MRVEAAGIGQYPNQGLADFFRLFADGRAGAIKGGAVGHHTEDSDGLRSVLADFFLELSASFLKFLAGELVRADIGVRSFAPITGDLSEAFLRLTEPRSEEEEADGVDNASGPPPPLRGDSPHEGGSAYPSPPRRGT